jgi:hypothetical protein
MYYALFDLQTLNYLNTGKNSKSIKELKADFIDYISIDFDDEKDLEFAKKETMENLADMWEFRIDKSRVKF